MRGPSRLFARALAAATLALPPIAGAFALHTDPTGLSAEARATSDALLADVAARLPPRWRDALGDVSVQWRDDLPADVDGRYVAGGVRLKRALLDGGAHASGSRPARAALLHELAHAWDRSPGGGLSRDSRLLDLAGWSALPIGPGRLRTNDFRDRSPDRYELGRPAEFVAVNLEHVLLDADYACRRPALYRYFVDRAGIVAPSPSCTPPVFLQPVTDGAADTSPVLALDPARVYAVDYLLAEPDAHPMSRWGHSMLRLVVCAPGRAPGPDCRLDLAWHVVLSFRAFVDDVQISSWRGLTGGYPSRLFVLPLPQVVESYTKVELRGLRAVPLRLSREEIAAVVERAAQVHWSYDGRYRFVTRNCAVETWRLLHDAVPRVASAEVGALTPTGLLQQLERAGIADASPLDDPDAARRLGYRFDSAATYFDTLLATAREHRAAPAMTAQKWFAQAPRARRPWFASADLKASAALLVLENAALRRAELRAADALKRKLPRRDAQDADAVLALAARLARPASFATAGYGVPQADELSRVRADAAVAVADTRVGVMRLREAAEAALDARGRDELAATRENVELIGARVRELASHPPADAR